MLKQFIFLFTFFLAINFITGCKHPTFNGNTQESYPFISEIHAQKLDRILALIDQRLEIAPLVAKSKWNAKLPIDDPQRESAILKDIDVYQSSHHECDFQQLKLFLQDQFDAGKMIQKRYWAIWSTTYPAGFQFQDAPNLARDIRPKIDKLMPELISAFCDIEPFLFQMGTQHYVQIQSEKIIRSEEDSAAHQLALRLLLPL